MEPLQYLQSEFDEFKATHPIQVFKGVNNTLEYLHCGTGSKTILLFHGLAGNAYSMYRFILALEKDFQIICPTIPVVRGSMNNLYAEIELLLLELKVSPSVVMGGSFGGLVAQAFWYRNPTAIDCVILFDTLPPNKLMGRKNQKKLRILGLLPWFLLKPLFREKLLRLFKVTSKLSPKESALLKFGKDQFFKRFKLLSKDLLLSHSNLSFDFMMNCQVPVLTQWKGKALVIYSQDDPAANNAAAWFKEVYPFSKQVSLKGAGHLGSLIDFDKYIQEIKVAIEQSSSRVT